MAQHTFRFVGPSTEYLTREVGASVTVVSTVSTVTKVVEVADEHLEELKGVMLHPNNFEYVGPVIH